MDLNQHSIRKIWNIPFLSTFLCTTTLLCCGCVFHPTTAEASVIWNPNDNAVSSTFTTTTLVVTSNTYYSASMVSSSFISNQLQRQQQQQEEKLSPMVQSSPLHPATPERPQIPLPSFRNTNNVKDNNFDITKKNNKNNPQILQALLQLSIPRSSSNAVSIYGTDILVVQVWNVPPPTTSTIANADWNGKSRRNNSPTDTTMILGGAKISLAATGSAFPLGIALGPQNAIQKESWQQSTTLVPQDLWIQATVCRPLQQEEEQQQQDTLYSNDVDKSNNINDITSSIKSTASSTVQLSTILPSCYPPSQYQPILQGSGISKWISLPSSTVGTTTIDKDSSNHYNNAANAVSDENHHDSGNSIGIRAPATVLLHQ
jgi:hypothetical protein